MSTMAQTEEQIKALEDAGVHVVVSDAQDIEGTYAAIRMIGALLGKNEEAETVIDGHEDDVSTSPSSASAATAKRPFTLRSLPLEYGLWTAGANTFMNEIAELLRSDELLCADVEGWAEISEEQVLERNPDYIMTISMYSGEGPTPVEGDRVPRRLGRPSPAVQPGNIYSADGRQKFLVPAPVWWRRRRPCTPSSTGEEALTPAA